MDLISVAPPVLLMSFDTRRSYWELRQAPLTSSMGKCGTIKSRIFRQMLQYPRTLVARSCKPCLSLLHPRSLHTSLTCTSLIQQFVSSGQILLSIEQLQQIVQKWHIGPSFWELLQCFGTGRGAESQDPFIVSQTRDLTGPGISYCARHVQLSDPSAGRWSAAGDGPGLPQRELSRLRQIGVHHQFITELGTNVFVIIYRSPAVARQLKELTRMSEAGLDSRAIHSRLLTYVYRDWPAYIDTLQTEVSEQVSDPSTPPKEILRSSPY